MDQKDIRILSALAEEETGSPEQLHQKTGLPTSTIHYRLTQLREEGIVRNDLFDVDLTELGLSITLITEVFAEFDEGYHHTVGEQLAEIEGVNQVYFTLGDTDFVVVSHVANREMVEGLIEEFERIDEIQRTSSTFVVTTVKDEPHPLNDYREETLVDVLCGGETDD